MKIVAEVGSNWFNVIDCVDSIGSAKRSGADAVKFQIFTYKELYGVEGGPMGFELPRAWIPELKDVADAHNIEFMCTAFSPDGYEFIDKFVKTHKIASMEITHLDILKTVNSFKKPVYLSTGGASPFQVMEALAYLPDCEVTVLYCVPQYPARSTWLPQMALLQELTRKPIGFSDHSLEIIQMPLWAKAMGAEVIEKHVNFVQLAGDTPDSPHSLNEYEFTVMCRAIKEPSSKQAIEDLVETVFCEVGRRWQRRYVKELRGYFRPRP